MEFDCIYYWLYRWKRIYVNSRGPREIFPFVQCKWWDLSEGRMWWNFLPPLWCNHWWNKKWFACSSNWTISILLRYKHQLVKFKNPLLLLFVIENYLFCIRNVDQKARTGGVIYKVFIIVQLNLSFGKLEWNFFLQKLGSIY